MLKKGRHRALACAAHQSVWTAYLELHKESLCALDDGSSHSLRVWDEHGIELGGELTLQDVADAAHGPEILRLRLEADCWATDGNQ